MQRARSGAPGARWTHVQPAELRRGLFHHRLDRRAVQQVLREIEKQDLLLALAGATPDMQDFFLANLSKRAAQDLRDELEILGPTPKITILQAQESIVIAAMQLAEDGMIYLPFGDDDEDDDGLM